MTSIIIQRYNNSVITHGSHLQKIPKVIAMANMCPFPSNKIFYITDNVCCDVVTTVQVFKYWV